MLLSKNLIKAKFHDLVHMHYSQFTEPLLIYGRPNLHFELVKNTDTVLTFTAGDR